MSSKLATCSSSGGDVLSHTHHTAQTCAVCTEDMHPVNYFVLPECGHAFHTLCIVHWFRSGQTRCPLCNNVGEGSRIRKFKTAATSVMSKLRIIKFNAEKTHNTSLIKRFYKLKGMRRTFMSARQAFRVFKRNAPSAILKTNSAVVKRYYQLVGVMARADFALRDERRAIVDSIPIAPIVIVSRREVRVPMITALAARRDAAAAAAASGASSAAVPRFTRNF